MMSLMGPLIVVKVKIGAEASFEFRPRGIVVQINIFVLHGAPEPFNENVIEHPPPAIHTHQAAGGLDLLNPRLGGKLHTLITIANLWSVPASARSKASRQKSVSRVLETAQATT